MRFNPKRLVAVPSSNPDVKRYVYGLHSVIVVGGIISFSSFGEGETSTDVKLAICRYLNLEDQMYLGGSVSESKAQEGDVAYKWTKNSQRGWSEFHLLQPTPRTMKSFWSFSLNAGLWRKSNDLPS